MQLCVLVFLCGIVMMALSSQHSFAQQINFNTFNSPQGAPSSPFSNICPAGTNILFCANYIGASPSFIQDFYPPAIDPFAATDGGAGSTNYALQLTPNAGSQTSSTWFSIPQDVADGFTTWFTFKINFQADYTAGHYFTADGMAFVMQNAAGGKTDSTSNCSVTGSGPTVLGGWGEAVAVLAMAASTTVSPSRWTHSSTHGIRNRIARTRRTTITTSRCRVAASMATVVRSQTRRHTWERLTVWSHLAMAPAPSSQIQLVL